MKWLIALIAALMFFAAACKGICDSLQFHYDTSFAAEYENEQFWNPQVSYKNKWEGGMKANGERFPGSSTVFVWTTDAWHLFQTVQYALIRLAVTLLLVLPFSITREPRLWHSVAVYAALWVVQAAGFHLFYTLL